MRQPIVFISVFISIVLLLSNEVFAARRGGGASGSHSMAFGALYVSPSQDDLNKFISDQGAVGTQSLGTGYEIYFQYSYRFSGTMWGIAFRPGFFTQKASGGATDVAITGITFTPLLRIHALENDFIKFFFQIGVNYGNATVKMSEPGGTSGTYDGNAFGGMGGIGVSFCFTESHCMTIEGNARYLPIMPVTGSGNTLTESGWQGNGELERSNNDVRVSLGGFQAALAYELNF